MDIFYQDFGNGVPVVLIGGLTSSHEVYQPQVDALSAQYRVLTPDNRGSGQTRIVDDDGNRAIDRMATDLLCFLDALELDRVHLMGTSMGGMIVQEFAVTHPDRLRSLTIGCSHGGTPTGNFNFYARTKELRPHSGEEVGRRLEAIINYDVWDRLPALRVPTLILTGDGDNIVPPENSQRLAKRIADSHLKVFDKAGHIFWIEQAEATNRALLEHFDAAS
jgi:pimeloyl-ACP methyl ester carboxylesterase